MSGRSCVSRYRAFARANRRTERSARPFPCHWVRPFPVSRASTPPPHWAAAGGGGKPQSLAPFSFPSGLSREPVARLWGFPPPCGFGAWASPPASAFRWGVRRHRATLSRCRVPTARGSPQHAALGVRHGRRSGRPRPAHPGGSPQPKRVVRFGRWRLIGV